MKSSIGKESGAMMLLTKENLKRLPSLGTTEEQGDNALVQVKFFTPDAQWTWYATEYDPEEGIFFGLVDGHEMELGYFSLAELQSIRGSFGLKVERDRGFVPSSLAKCRRGY
jgi:hypothetical protein